MPFQIMVKSCNKDIFHIVIDEGASIIILSSIAWKSLGSSQPVSTALNLLDFNKRTNQPLRVLPQLPINLEGKTVCIDVMVVIVPLDLNFLLG